MRQQCFALLWGFNMKIDRISCASMLVLGSFLATSSANSEPVSSQDEVPPVNVEAAGTKGNNKRAAETEGTGSYAPSAVTIGGKEAIAWERVPQSVSVVTHQQMVDQNMTTAWDALSQVVGVTAISNDPSQQQFHSRGFALNAANDGMPAFSGLSGYQQLDLAIYDRVEVLKGPAGLFVGSGSPAGVVNFVKKRAGSDPKVEGIASYGSWDNKRGVLDVNTPLNRNKSLRGRMVLVGQDRDFFFDRAHERRWTGYGTVEYDLTPNTTVTTSIVAQDYLGPSYSGQPADAATGAFLPVPRSFNPYPAWTYLKWNIQDYSTNIEHRFGDGWTAKFSASRRDSSFRFHDAFPVSGVSATGTATYRVRDWIYDYQRDAADAYINGPFEFLGRTHNLLLGYNYDAFSSVGRGRTLSPDVKNVSVYNPDGLSDPVILPTNISKSETVQHGAYGQLRLNPIDRTTLVVGGRLSNFDSRWASGLISANPAFRQAEKVNNYFSPYAALLLEASRQLTFYGSYSDIFSPQTALRHTGETLEPRVGGQYEIGVKGKLFDDRLNASVAAFHIRDKNRAFADPDHPGFFIPLGEVEARGFETEVSGSPVRGWSVTGGYTFLEQWIVMAAAGVGNPISAWYPRHSVKSWAKYEFDHGPFAGLSLGAGVVMNSLTLAGVNATMRSQPLYAVVNAMVSYTINDKLSVSLNLNNVFDTAYFTRLGGLNTYNYPGDPRNFMLSVRGKI